MGYWNADALVKWKRANTHRKTLDDEITAWRGRNPSPCDIQRIRNEATQRWDWTVVNAEPAPAEWGAIIGDAVTNYNSALDITYNQTVEAITGRRCKDNFPIWNDRAHFEKTADVRLANAPPEVAELIRRYEPFDGGASSAFRVVRRLDNQNKHALLLTTMVGQAGITANLGRFEGGGLVQMDIPTAFGRLETGLVLFSESFDTIATAEPRCFLALAGTGFVDEAPVFEVLQVCHDVAADVINAFGNLLRPKT